MICNNCGAHFDDNLPNCPYCNTFHYPGARKEYMEKLDDLRENLDELHETIPEMYTSELKSQTKNVKKIFFVIAGIFAAFALLFFITVLFSDSFHSANPKDTLLFTKEAYPVADEFYASGDYDGLLNFYQTSITENEHADFYNWEHYPFLICYENLTIFRESAKKFGTEEFSAFDMHEIFYCYLSNNYHQKGYPMETDDQEMAAAFEEEMETFIDQLNLTEKEFKNLNDLLNSGEYPSWEKIEDFSKQIYQRLY